MTIEDEKKAKKTVLVGIRLDSQNREQINWALVKVAEAGDCVVAIHVCRNSDRAFKDKPLLDEYLDVYEGLCKEKQVNLTGKISLGSSIRKVMVKEARICAADTLIVGVNKPNALGSWSSVAKYCTKHLPETTKVIAVNNGKVIFTNCAATKEDSRQNLTKKLIQKGDTDDKTDYSKPDGIKRDNASRKVNSRSISLFAGDPLIEQSQSQRPGWPLMRTTTLPPKPSEARKQSVVQWVMSLPDRSPPQTPQSSSKTDHSEFNITPSDTNSPSSSDSNSPSSKSELEILFKSCSFGFKWFSHEVLKIITSQFSSENLIGKGGSNRVYKGSLPDGEKVAVKVLNSSGEESWKEFATEIDIITSLKHKHITTLIGICVEDNSLISVYDYLPKGSLDENLHPTKYGGEVLSWEVRFNIAVGIAEAIRYLHDECSGPIIHRDVKSSNILLSDTLEPQLCDFGLAIWGPTASSFFTKVDIVGTFGYLAPEYFMYGKVSNKIDVYSYGVVLLELLSGKKPICSETGQESLVMWAKPKIENGDIKGLLDPNLDGKNIDEIQVKRVVLAATLCLTRSARLRPKMSEILKVLKGDKDIENWVKFESENPEENDDEVYPELCAESHLSLALLDVNEDLSSVSSMDQSSTNIRSVEDYLRGRYSRSLSLD